MIGIEAILETFESEPGPNTELFNNVLAEHGWSEACDLWSRACAEYDRIHMTSDEYADQYGGDT